MSTAAMLARRGWEGPWDFAATSMTCNRPPIEIEVTLDGFLNHVDTASPPSKITLHFGPPKPVGAGSKSPILGLSTLGDRFDAATFAIMAEVVGDWVKSNISTDYKTWPSIANFCRVVRNAIVHGGTINIHSPTAPRVYWRGISFDHTNHGQQVFSPHSFTTADLFVLMLDLEDELNILGAPLDLS